MSYCKMYEMEGSFCSTKWNCRVGIEPVFLNALLCYPLASP